MKITTFRIACFVTALLGMFVCSPVLAQTPDKSAHIVTGNSVKDLYNQQKFHEIYLLTNQEFMTAVSETDLVDLMEKGIFSELGEMTDLAYLSRNKDYFAFLATFKSGQLEMDLLLDADKKITFFQFIPYTESLKTKITDFMTDNKKLSPLDSAVHAAVLSFIQSPQNCGISIGLSVNGNQSYYNYGETRRNSKQLPGKNSIYEIGSVSKTFCGLLLAMAVTEKKIKLDDEIIRHLPGKYPNLPTGKKAIRIKHLANHTSGLPRMPENLMTAADFDSLNPYKNYGRQMVYDYLKTAKPDKEAGTVCEYSNYGMALLGLILEDIYKKSFEELVKEKICQPNGMSNTTVKLSPEQAARFVTGYDTRGEETPHWELNGFSSAGALRSDCEDLLKYLEYNRKENDAATQLAHKITFSDRQNVGLAWFISKTKAGNNLVWHNGGTYGFSSFCGYLKEKDCAISILANSGTNTDYIAIAILNYLQTH